MKQIFLAEVFCSRGSAKLPALHKQIHARERFLDLTLHNYTTFEVGALSRAGWRGDGRGVLSAVEVGLGYSPECSVGSSIVLKVCAHARDASAI